MSKSNRPAVRPGSGRARPAGADPAKKTCANNPAQGRVPGQDPGASAWVLETCRFVYRFIRGSGVLWRRGTGPVMGCRIRSRGRYPGSWIIGLPARTTIPGLFPGRSGDRRISPFIAPSARRSRPGGHRRNASHPVRSRSRAGQRPGTGGVSGGERPGPVHIVPLSLP